MPWIRSLHRICTTQTFFRLSKHYSTSQLRRAFGSCTIARATHPTRNSPCMPEKRSRPSSPEQAPKRRKAFQSPSYFIQPFAQMASQDASQYQLELTEVESKLRQLLLDVASYIDDHNNTNNGSFNEDTTAVHVPKELAGEKVVLRWTGGWVRDKLLKVGSHDIDLAINNMTGEHFGLKMQEYLEIPGNAEKHGLIDKGDKSSTRDKSKKIAPGLHKIEANPEKSKNLETATTKILGIELDLVNLRKETYNEVSRNPQMEFGTAEEDAMRRDATVNAMFYNLHTCQVEDFTQRGHEDMAAKIIRTPLEPMQTFKDDPLRVLRLIRFASRLDYTIEEETAKAMGNPEIQDVLKVKISRERVGIELEKMLRGPRPRMALELIDRFGLYRTVFTDPTRQLPSEPDTEYFQPAYDFVNALIEKDESANPPALQLLLRDAEERYMAWICAAMIPWADAPTVPHPKPAQRPFYTAYLVAREGFKAPNRVCDIVTASLTHGEEIRKTVSQCARGLQRPDTIQPNNDPTARDTLGMALRRWGSTWRVQILFNLTYEIVLAQVPREELLRAYSSFLEHVAKLEILEVDTFKPLLKGTDLAKALNTKPGPWMKDALDVVMAWQLRNPSSTDVSAAIEAVKATRDEQTNSELPLCLASHFIQLTIPPLFPQNKTSLSALEASRQPAPWKDAGAQYALDLLRWSIRVMDKREIEGRWSFLVPPILKMMDDMEVKWKAKGCQLLNLLLNRLRQPGTSSEASIGRSRQAGPLFLHRSGYHNVFAETLFPLLTYIPSLTPEGESVLLFQQVLPAITSLAMLLPDEGGPGETREGLMDRVMREGVVAPLGHFPTPSTYPELAVVIVSHMQLLLDEMAIDSVKHLSAVLPLLTDILQEPFVLGHERLGTETLGCLQAAMLTAWPRVAGHRGAIMMGLCTCWRRCKEEAMAGGGKVREVGNMVRDTAAMLDAIMRSEQDGSLRARWEEEKAGMVQASAIYSELLVMRADPPRA